MGRRYSHASIALDEKIEYFYSFNSKGFRREYPRKHEKRVSKNSVAYKLEISEEEYRLMQDKLNEMESRSSKLHYSRLGVLFSLLHISFHRKNHYFCSEFVAEMLRLSKAVKLEKKPSRYLPGHLVRELSRQSCLKAVIYNPI